MTPFTVRAPGKVVLVGEYAVVDGATAVVAAVDRGVRCDVAPADALEIVTPSDDRYARAALSGAPAARYAFSDWNPTDLPEKPGLGGSAAATVAAVRARLEVAGAVADAGAVHAGAARIHREVQGSGSGIDVAASAFGGVLRFREGTVTALPPIDPVIVWSGRSAATGPRVQAYLRWGNRDRFVADSAAIADRFADDPIAALREATRLLAHMTALVDIPWDTPAHRLIRTLAGRYGGAAKPSGAGGGDVAVALFPDLERKAAFSAACAAAGFPVIPASLAPGAAVAR